MEGPGANACQRCHRHKVKCSRLLPCTNCVKLGVECVPGIPVTPRKRQGQREQLLKKIVECEDAVAQLVEAQLGGRMTTSTQGATSLRPEGSIVKDDGSLVYAESHLIASVYSRLRDLRLEIAPDDSEVTDQFCADGDFSPVQEPAPRSTAELRPLPGHTRLLWQIFLDRFNPLTKIVHSPTLQPHVLRFAAGSWEDTPSPIKALLFSIFLTAVLTMTEDECQGALGQPKEAALERLSTATRRCLSQADILRSSNMDSLRAFFLYALSLRGRCTAYEGWVMNGMVIRIAQGMGLHKDGGSLGMTPFETEMRRRLWWQVVTADMWYAMSSELSHSLLPQGWDTRMPKNLDDEDLTPLSEELTVDREGPTEMIFCLVNNEITRFLVTHPEFGRGEADGMAELDYALGRIIDRFYSLSGGKIHDLALMIRRQIVDKFCALATPRDARSATFEMAVVAAEWDSETFESVDDVCFRWFSLVYMHPELFLFMLVEVPNQDGDLAKRAWRQIEANYERHDELRNLDKDRNAMMARFLVKAWEGRGDRRPGYVEELGIELARRGAIGVDEGVVGASLGEIGCEFPPDSGEGLGKWFLGFGLAPAEW